MSDLVRFGVSLSKNLLDDFDKSIKDKGYETRSKAIEELIKDHLAADVTKNEGVLAGAITFLYDHHNKELLGKLLEIQHSVHDIVISMQHIHLDHDNCLEFLAVKGEVADVKKLFHNIKALKGIKLATLSASKI